METVSFALVKVFTMAKNDSSFMEDNHAWWYINGIYTDKECLKLYG